jgi:hypothetical protein
VTPSKLQNGVLGAEKAHGAAQAGPLLTVAVALGYVLASDPDGAQRVDGARHVAPDSGAVGVALVSEAALWAAVFLGRRWGGLLRLAP